MSRSSPPAAAVAGAALVAALASAGCDSRAQPPSPYATAGNAPASRTLASDRTAAPPALTRPDAPRQARDPVAALQTYLDGFHFHHDDPSRQAETHQWCTRLDADFAQCAIFDGAGRDARLIGVEYVVSERVYMQLPAEEKRLWHSHAYDVRSGTLVAPGLPELAEHELMQRIVRTYGKSWTTWPVDRDPRLPTGTPELLMSFTADGQADSRMIAARDRRLGTSTAGNARNRADIEAPRIDSEADAWQRGAVPRLALEPITRAASTAEAPGP